MLPHLCTSLGVVLAAVAVGVGAQLTVTQPSSDHWWVANSLNTLAWSAASGNSISQFSVFLANSDANILNNKLALISIQPTYDYSKTISPINVTPGTGYVVQLTDTLNSSNIYASSESFEIKPVGSAYPAQSSPSGTTNSSASASGSGSGSGTSAAASASASKAAASHALDITWAQGVYGLPLMAGMAAALLA